MWFFLLVFLFPSQHLHLLLLDPGGHLGGLQLVGHLGLSLGSVDLNNNMGNMDMVMMLAIASFMVIAM